MSTFTKTANTASTLATGYYGTDTYHEDVQASQGCYYGSTTTGRKTRAGIMVFTGAGATLKGKTITSIKIKTVASTAGGSGSSKVLTFRKSKYQLLDKDIACASYVGDKLGTLTGKFYNNTVTHTLNSTTNASLFAALKEYLEAGNSALVIYNGETATSGYSTNYAVLTSVTLTVEYEDSYVYYNDEETATMCEVYYNDNGTPVKCAIYYNDNGTAVKV